MNFGREVARQTSCYTYVIGDEDPALACLNVFELTEKGDQALLESLVRKNPEVLREKDESGASPVHHAAAGGHVGLIHFISAVMGLHALNSRDDHGNVPLHLAVDKNQAESCRALLDLKADPNILNKALLSPLHLAISHGHNNLVELLLSYSTVDYNQSGDLGNTPCMMACSLNNCEALTLLIKHGARLCQQNKLGHFAVHAAAFAGARKAMEVILKAGEELGYFTDNHINYVDKSNSSPLHLAVRGGNIETIRFCIAMGAKVDQQQHDRSTPLHLACTQGAIEVVKLMLCSYGRVEEIINLKDGACQTPLHRATIFDHVELADYLISLGAEVNSTDCKGNSPLLVATSCGAWRTVALLLSKGANVSLKDKFGCNFLHLAILQPKGLKNLPEDILQRNSVKALLSCEDNEGCTPLHYACRLGIHDSVRNMLGLSGQLGLACKSKDKKSALHFAAQYGRVNTCHRLLETIKDSRLLNEGDERGLTPLHLASRGGHTEVVELLLRKGALFHSDYKGWTCLHHAASEGFTQTMDIILSANMKLLDKTDEDGNTALHIAARMGHVAAVMVMVNRAAEFTLNKNDTSFLHEALQNGKQDVVNAVIDSERCVEALVLFKPGSPQRSPILDMIEYLPETYKHLLDCCVRESEDDHNSPNYNIEYDFKWLQAPLEMQKDLDKSHRVQPLASLNAMVKYNRLELLNHPVCNKYLSMKWAAYGSTAHMLNMFLYLLGLLPLTHLIVTLRPSMNITETGERQLIMVPVSLKEQSLFLSFCMVMVLVMNIYAIIKEVLQIIQQRWNYIKDYSNQNDWFSAIFSLLFVIPLMANSQGSLHWQAGAMAVLQSWVGFLLYLQRFEGIGIYVVMFGEIMRTLYRVVMLFFYLLLAFALAFHALMLNQREFDNVPLALMQSFVMMVGELNYQNNFLDAYLNNELPFDFLTLFILTSFVLLMPILLVNLMIGLAVGDIAEVQKNAAMKRIAMQIDLHTALEDKLPYWFIKRADKPSIVVYPNRKCSKHFIMQLLSGGGEDGDDSWKRTQAASQTCSTIQNELKKQKCRMKEMSNILEKQHTLLKLIIQKMDITSEADEYDGPVNKRGSMWPRMCPPKRSSSSSSSVSRWVPLMKAIESKPK
ncbi:transient receptor potential cation channel subfamily A member 1b [Dunckerocampus dactyliophorus]|uniref:transient receptor potential cation channel subfamily A member 1b n=1 Tax=Dunckerocampus dactyliophorus TaxID=161453 RepID=UPI00240593B0|nr:transient receptor potential cation channel subfamily A member 1b [Dunckerocampus dactyliophorus]